MKLTLKGSLPFLMPLFLAACGGSADNPVQQPNVQASMTKSSAQTVVAASAYDAVVQRIYLAYFGRPADPAGQAYWAEQYRIAGMPTDLPSLRQAYDTNPTVRSFVDVFGTSQESKDLYPGNNAAFIDAVYKNLFSRPADSAGQAYWVDLLDRGLITRASAALTLMNGALGTDRTIIDNKMSVSAGFTAGLNTDARKAAYSGNAANAVVRSMLLQVTHTTDVAAFQSTINSTIGQLAGEQPGGGGGNPSGQYLGFLYGMQQDKDHGFAVVPASGGAAVSVIPAGHAVMAGGASSGTVNNYIISNARIHSYMLWKDQQLVRQDLISSAGVPALVQVTTLTKAETCNDYSMTWGNNVINPASSFVFFRKAGADSQCDTSDDTFVAVRMNASPTSAPQVVNQPVATHYLANGTLAGVLVKNGQTVQRLDANLANPVTLFTLPGSDLINYEGEDDMWHAWIFQSGKGVYGWDLATAGAGTPTLIKNLGPMETLVGHASIDLNDAFVAVRDQIAGTVQVLRYNFAAKTTTVVGSMAAAPTANFSIKLTPTRVILRDAFSGTVSAMPRSGGSATAIYTPATQSPMAMAAMVEIVGERVWVGGFFGSSVATFNSDGSGLKTFPNGAYTGCVFKSSAYVGDNGCESIVVNDGGSVGAYDGISGNLKLTYGNIAVPTGETFATAMLSSLSYWGQGNVITQAFYKDEIIEGNYYFLTTDRAGIQKLTLP